MVANDVRRVSIIFPTKWVLAIPNKLFGTDFKPERTFVRMPLGQDIIFNTMYSLFVDNMFDWTGMDDISVDALDSASSILLEAFPVEMSWVKDDPTLSGMFAGFINNTIFGPIAQVAMNRTYYNSKIINDYLAQKAVYEQYSNDTPQFFIDFAEFLYRELGVEVAPDSLEYLAKQESGYFGYMALPFLSRNRGGGWDINTAGRNLLNTLRNSWTIDPAYTNDVSDAYENTVSEIDIIIAADRDENRTSPFLPYVSTTADREEVRSALEDLESTRNRIENDVGILQRERSANRNNEDISESERALIDEQLAWKQTLLKQELLDEYIAFEDMYGERTIWGDLADYVTGLFKQQD